MRRHDYRLSVIAQLTGYAPAPISIGGLRIPLAITGAALLLVALIWSTEVRRIATLDRELVVIKQHAMRAAFDARRTQAISGLVERERQIDQRLRIAHRTAVASSNVIAMIGNGLPLQTWLTNVTSAPGGNWTISGRSTRVAEIGTTLRAIQRLDAGSPAHLVSISAGGRSNSVLDFVIGWDRQP
jgi:hypothetical protein